MLKGEEREEIVKIQEPDELNEVEEKLILEIVEDEDDDEFIGEYAKDYVADSNNTCMSFSLSYSTLTFALSPFLLFRSFIIC